MSSAEANVVVQEPPRRRRARRRKAPMTIATLPDLAAEKGHRTPVVLERPLDVAPDLGTHLDYGELADLVESASGWLRAAGVEPWDRVAIQKRNHLDILVLASAAARLGAVPTLLSPKLDPHAAGVLVSRLDRPVVVTDASTLGRNRDGGVDVPALAKRAIVVDADGSAGGAISLDDLRGAPVPPSFPRQGGEPALITHTSGTTGVPKLVQHSVDTISALVSFETRRWPLVHLRSRDVCGICLSYVHARSITGWATVLHAVPSLVALSEPDPRHVTRLFGRYQPTIVETHPNIYITWEGLAADATAPFARTRLFISTFDAIHPRTVRSLLAASRRRFPLWAQGWGQSEIGGATVRLYTRRSVRRRGEARSITRNVGTGIPFTTKVRITNPETGVPVRRGRVGLVEVSTPSRCVTYVGEDDRHRQKCWREWWNTGDMGEQTRWSGVRLLDREVDLIEGASCIELEDTLLDRLPDATEVVVLAAPGLPLPVVSTHGDRPLDPERWRTATAGLAALAPPVQVPWGEIPRTATWKVRRFLLRERLLNGMPTIGTGHWT
jgi:acyl-coenzyme A synthetase/AMP-(fatty) acid ligase